MAQRSASETTTSKNLVNKDECPIAKAIEIIDDLIRSHDDADCTLIRERLSSHLEKVDKQSVKDQIRSREGGEEKLQALNKVFVF